MKLRGSLVGFGIGVAGLSVGGCGEGQPVPAAVMHVDCDRVPGDAYILSLNTLDVPAGTEEVQIDIADHKKRITLNVQLLGRVTVNGTEVYFDDAGDALEQLPTATLIAGVPAPFDEVYYAGDEGLTLACNGASIADIRTNESSN